MHYCLPVYRLNQSIGHDYVREPTMTHDNFTFVTIGTLIKWYM